MFTLDKLLVAIIKQVRHHGISITTVNVNPVGQVQTIEADSKCQELWELLQVTRKVDTLTMQDVIRYRREAEQHVGSDENLYRIEWVSDSLIPEL